MVGKDLNPGRELDALVAEKVMGRRFTRHLCEPGTPPHEWVDSDVPEYSTDIAAAWGVVEKLREHFAGVEVMALTKTNANPNYFEAKLWANTWVHSFAEAPTAPHAICLAALKAVGA
jgi:hypothetical protein